MEQPRDEKYTYADYYRWNDGRRYELIDGEVFLMSPAPSPAHQRVSGALFAQLYNYLKGKPCEVFAAPFDVRLDADGADDTVVQPDISVICDPGKIDDRGCKGVPDLVMEILSPSNSSREQMIKFNKYMKAGIPEYWIVSPQMRTVHVNLLENGRYLGYLYDDEAVIPVGVLDDCHIHMADVFPALPAEAPSAPGIPAAPAAPAEAAAPDITQ